MEVLELIDTVVLFGLVGLLPVFFFYGLFALPRDLYRWIKHRQAWRSYEKEIEESRPEQV